MARWRMGKTPGRAVCRISNHIRATLKNEHFRPFRSDALSRSVGAGSRRASRCGGRHAPRMNHLLNGQRDSTWVALFVMWKVVPRTTSNTLTGFQDRCVRADWHHQSDGFIYCRQSVDGKKQPDFEHCTQS